MSDADWITAVSTAITALGAGAGAYIGWLTLQRDSRHDLPVLELYGRWIELPTLGTDGIELTLWVNNRLDERISLQGIRLLCPAGAKFAPAKHEVGPDGLSIVSAGDFTDGFLSKTFEIGRRGSVRQFGSVRRPTDTEQLLFYMLPPVGTVANEDFGDLKVVMELSVSSKANTIHRKRMTVHEVVEAKNRSEPT